MQDHYYWEHRTTHLWLPWCYSRPPALSSGTTSLLFWCTFTTCSSLPWRHNSDIKLLPKRDILLIEKQRIKRNSCNNKRGHMLVWFSLRSPGLGEKKELLSSFLSMSPCPSWQLLATIFFFQSWETNWSFLYLQAPCSTNTFVPFWIHEPCPSKLFVYLSHCFPYGWLRPCITKNCVPSPFLIRSCKRQSNAYIKGDLITPPCIASPATSRSFTALLKFILANKSVQCTALPRQSHPKLARKQHLESPHPLTLA